MSDEFKETLIGKIPKDWEIKELGEVCTFETGKRMKGGALKEGEVFSLGGEHITDDGRIVFSPKKFVSLDFYKNLKKGRVSMYDVLMCKDGAKTGKVGLVRELPYKYCAVNEHVYIIRSSTKMLSNIYLFYFLHSKYGQEQIRNYFHGLIGGITNKDIKSIKIPLPPLPEQKKIAEILSTIDKAIEKTDALIHHYQQLKNALMQKLFTEGIGHTKFKSSPLGQIPVEWDVAKIGDIIEFAQYGLSIKMYDEGQYPIVKMDSIVNGKVMPVNLKYVNLDEETFNKFKLEKGDVLVNRTNSYELVGKTGIFMLEGDYVFASYLIRLRPKRDIVDSVFLTYYLILSQDRLRQIATRGVSQANINATNLKKFLVPLPPLEEQKKIAQILMTIDNKIEAEMKTKEELEKLKQGMMDKLLTGKVRVKVGEESGQKA
ncbi:restriction endonuclease subunit S [Thermococcus sp.]|uniref:restriction endonuclease subunit S n=1 Tax=Thermococcus sp. TaxID=35749 RepID=UPI002603E2D1|nr:restriction endonuclease subunit S [Thermococcus sp.]